MLRPGFQPGIWEGNFTPTAGRTVEQEGKQPSCYIVSKARFPGAASIEFLSLRRALGESESAGRSNLGMSALWKLPKLPTQTP